MDDPAVAAGIEHDLMHAGGRLRWIGDGTGRTTWRDVAVLYSLAAPGSALARATGGDSVWGLPEQLLAGVIDHLAVIAWQRTEDGSKGRNRPKPIPRPGIAADGDQNEPGQETTHYGEAVDLATVNDMFADMWAEPDAEEDSPSRPDRRAAAVAEYAAGGVTYADLAATYGVSPSTIGRWVRQSRTT